MSISFRNLSRSRTPKGRHTARTKTSFFGDPEEREPALASLNQTQKLFERSGRFKEAESTKKKGVQLKQGFYKKQLQAIKKQHSNQNQQIYLNHQLEMKKFQIAKLKRLGEYSNQLKEREEEMKKRHEQELKQYGERLERQHPLKLRESPHLMNYRKVLEKLVKQEKYFEADQLQLKINNLEKQELPKFMYERGKKIENCLFQRREKQKHEMAALKQKLKSGFDENKGILENQERQLKQKYQNIMADFELSQKLELRMFDKEMKVHKDKYSVTKAFTYLGN